MPTTWTAQKIHVLTQPELRALFRVITRRRDRALFLIAYRHGLRTSEVGLLRVDDLNFAKQRLTIHRVKRSLPGIYPLQADEITALKAYLRARKNDSPTLFLSQRGRPISRRQLDTLMKHYGEEAGIPASRWLPVVGALGVAAYAYRDTRRVGHTAIELFSREVALEDDPA